MNTQTFNGRVSEFLRDFLGDSVILAHWQEKKMDQKKWLESVKKDLFHLISIAAVALGQKSNTRADFKLNSAQIDQIVRLGNLWIKIRGNEVHPPNSQDRSAKRAIRSGITSIVEAAINGKELVLLTNLCPNHQFDEKGIFVSDEIHPNAVRASKELENLREEFRKAGITNMTHIILFGDVDLSQALLERFSKEELIPQLEANFEAWKDLFAARGVRFHKMTDFFGEDEWEALQKENLEKIKGGFLLQQISKVAAGRDSSKFAQRSGRFVSQEEVLHRTQDSIAAHLATNKLVKEQFSTALMLDVSGGIDLVWTLNVFGKPTVCLSSVRNHQPWRNK